MADKKISETSPSAAPSETAEASLIDAGVNIRVSVPNLRKKFIDPTQLATATDPVDASVSEVTEAGVPLKITYANLRKVFDGVVGSLGERLVSYNWPQDIVYVSGSYDHTNYTGSTGTWVETPHKDGNGRVDWVDIVAPAAGGTWRQTLTYTGNDLTNISAWIKQ
jgi:hypothetical protein